MLFLVATALAASPWLDCEQPEKPLLDADLGLTARTMLPFAQAATARTGSPPTVVFVPADTLPPFPTEPFAVHVDERRKGPGLVALFEALKATGTEVFVVHRVFGLSPEACPTRRDTLPDNAIALIPMDPSLPARSIGPDTYWFELVGPLPYEVTIDPRNSTPLQSVRGIQRNLMRLDSMEPGATRSCLVHLTANAEPPTSFLDVDAPCADLAIELEEQLKPGRNVRDVFMQIALKGPIHADPLRLAAPLVASRDLEVRRQKRPDFPEEAPEQGDVRCKAHVWISKKGFPEEIVVEDCPEVFHASMKDAIAQWKWFPPEIDGERQGVRTLIAVNYRAP